MLPKNVLTFYCLKKMSQWSQNFCKFSVFGLEFQKFFVNTKTHFSHIRSEQSTILLLFLTVDQIVFIQSYFLSWIFIDNWLAQFCASKILFFFINLLVKVICSQQHLASQSTFCWAKMNLDIRDSTIIFYSVKKIQSLTAQFCGWCSFLSTGVVF